MPDRFRYVKGFDAIRFLAVVLVIIGHWGLYFPEGSKEFNMLRVLIPWGKFGLAFFLVLSGFLISSSLFQARLRMEEGENKLGIVKNFLVRRALRLLPAYYLMLFILYLLGHDAVREYPWYFLTHTSNILLHNTQYPNTLVHLWSLSVQEQFYLVLPWFILFVNQKYLKYILYAAMAIGLGTKYYDMFVLKKGFTTMFYQNLFPLGLGVLYAYFIYLGKKAKFERAIRFVLPILLYLGWQLSVFRGSPLGVAYERTMWSVMGLCVIIFTANNKNAILARYFFENKALIYFGKISYGIYLYHYATGAYLEDSWLQYRTAHGILQTPQVFVIVYVVKFAIVLLIASVSYNFVETPIINLKKNFKLTRAKNANKIEEPDKTADALEAAAAVQSQS